MHIAVTLRERLPRIGALFMDGRISAHMMSAIAWRTRLITDDDALRQIDAALAGRVTAWGSLSDVKLEKVIERWIDRYDPGALRQTRAKARSREVCFGGLNDEDPAGTRAMWGRLYATDAQLLDRRLQQMAQALCDADPRTIAQRRADALGAVAAGSDRLACTCGSPDCPNADRDGRAASVVIHVVADEAAIADKPDPQMNGEASQPNSSKPKPDKPPAALLMGGGIVPTPLLAELIKNGAKIRPIPGFAHRYLRHAAVGASPWCRLMAIRGPVFKSASKAI